MIFHISFTLIINYMCVFHLYRFLPANRATQKITATIKKLYDRPVKNFSDLREEEKRRWYNDWKV